MFKKVNFFFFIKNNFIVLDLSTDDTRIFNGETTVMNLAVRANFTFRSVGQDTVITLSEHFFIFGASDKHGWIPDGEMFKISSRFYFGFNFEPTRGWK